MFNFKNYTSFYVCLCHILFLLVTLGYAELTKGDLVFTTSGNGKMYGMTGMDDCVSASVAVSDGTIYPGHVGVYIGKINGEDKVVEALGVYWFLKQPDMVQCNPLSNFSKVIGGDRYLGAKTHNNVSSLQRDNIVILAEDQVGENYDSGGGQQKGPSSGTWICCGLAEKVYESCSGFTLVYYGSAPYDLCSFYPGYPGGLDITPDGYDSTSNSDKSTIGNCFSTTKEFSKVNTSIPTNIGPCVYGRNPDGHPSGFLAGIYDYYIFFPYTQYLQSSLKFTETPHQVTAIDSQTSTKITSSTIISLNPNDQKMITFKVANKRCPGGISTEFKGPNTSANGGYLSISVSDGLEIINNYYSNASDINFALNIPGDGVGIYKKDGSMISDSNQQYALLDAYRTYISGDWCNTYVTFKVKPTASSGIQWIKYRATFDIADIIPGENYTNDPVENDKNDTDQQGWDVYKINVIITSNTFSISGYIKDNSGTGINGVNVILSGASSGTYTTPITGYYEFHNLNNGNYTITPNKIDYSFDSSNLVYWTLTSDMVNQNFTGTPIQNKIFDIAWSTITNMPTAKWGVRTAVYNGREKLDQYLG